MVIMAYWDYYPPYVSVAEKKAKAAKKLKQLKKKNPHIKPIMIEGRAIARTWWGKSWNVNLERYADYSNRIGRGRSYVRHGAVLDLQIDSGQIDALVQGSRSRPYSVTIKIKAIAKEIWKKIKTSCEGKLDSLPELLAGKFPRSMDDIFMAEGKGLFPSPHEIEFDCTCPDWAYMCKHVAATLYGISARLDEDPGLFFKLRKVNVGDLITQAVEDKTRKLLKTAEKKSKRVIADSDLADIFGIELEGGIDYGVNKPTAMKKSSPRKKSNKKKGSELAVRGVKTKGRKRKPGAGIDAKKKITRTASQKSGVKKAGRKPSERAKSETATRVISTGRRKSSPATNADRVKRMIKRSKQGIDVPTLKKKTGIDEQKIRNIVYGAFKKGEIKRAGRGVYAGK